MALAPARGTHDILPDTMRRHRHVEETVREVTGRYGFQEMSTPIFEALEVFARTLGDTSDIVTKEMYTFEDRGGDPLTLRPEGTAGVVRAFISNGLANQTPIKAFYRGPMFRYERPQKGRQRQFHQVGVELLGVESPQADVEVVAMGAHVLDALGLKDKVVCELNSLGDPESRAAFRDKLVAYLNDFRGELSEDSLARLEKNPLRIFDTKDEGDRKIIDGAPLLVDSLNDPSKRFLDDLLAGLDAVGMRYKLNPQLVRGLDYYCHTAFEFTTDTLGSQGTVLAGGRYDGLVKQMGGSQTPGIGWAAGVERLALMLDGEHPARRPLAMIPVGDEAQGLALKLTQTLRQAGHAVDLGYSGNMKKRMKRANKVAATCAIMLGEDELARGTATVRDMESGEQTEVSLEQLENHLARYR